MDFFLRILLLLLLLPLTTHCAVKPPIAPDVDVSKHLADADAGAVQGVPDFPSLEAFEQKILAIRDEWDQKLQAPEKLLTFHDFSTPQMTAAREKARASDFAAALEKDLTLEGVLAGAFERNPDLKAAQRKLVGTIEQYAQVTYLDTIMRQYSSFLRSMKLGVGPTIPMDMMSKRFPFPGTLELKAAIVGHAVEEARARYEGTLRDIVTHVRVAYAEYAFLGSAIGITAETINYLRNLEDTARSKLSTGTARKAHVIQTQVQISKFDNDLITMRRNRDTVRARLNTLMDLSPQGALAEPQAPPMPPLPKSIELLYETALQQQPDIQAAQARAARMAAMIELAEQATYPDLSVGLSYMEDLSFPTGGSQKEKEPFGTKPKVKPDPWFGTKDAYLREAREAERGARDKVRAARDRTLFRVKDAYNTLDTASRLYELYKNVQISQAAQAYKDASSGYSANRVEFLNVIDALRQYLRFQLDADRALRDYYHGYARLQSAVGGALPEQKK